MSDAETAEPEPSPDRGRWGGLWARLLPTVDALFGIDLRALAALRIGLALLILFDLVGRACDLEAHYTDFGVMPRPAVYLFDGDRWANLSPYMWVDGIVPVACLMLIAAVFAVMLLVGYRTRIAAVVTYFLLAGIHSRNPMVLHGADLALRMLLFWALWTPIGARWSLDGTIAHHRLDGRQVLPRRVLSAGTAALLLQVGILYWFTAASKTAPEWRRDGTALYYALSIEQYQTPVGAWLRAQAPLLKPLSLLSWWMECLGPTIAFLPIATARIRTVLAALFIGFHLIVLNLCFDLGPFPYVAALLWVPFLPTEVWDAAERAWARLSQNPVKQAFAAAATMTRGWQRRVVEQRRRLGRPAPTLGLGLEWQATVVFLAVYILLWNLRGLDFDARRDWVPPPIDFMARMLRLDQGWGMFAPRPMIDDGWYVMPAKLKKDPDFRFDMYTGKDPIDWSKPVHIVSMYPSERWRKYLMNLWGLHNVNQRVYYASWVCRHWNRVHRDGDQLDRFQIVYMLKSTRLNYAVSKPVHTLLWNHFCFGTPNKPALQEKTFEIPAPASAAGATGTGK